MAGNGGDTANGEVLKGKKLRERGATAVEGWWNYMVEMGVVTEVIK